jgi:hypothetical protein
MEDDAQRAYSLGAAAYLRRPIERAELLHILEQLCGEGGKAPAPLLITETAVAAAERPRGVVTLEDYRAVRNGDSERR